MVHTGLNISILTRRYIILALNNYYCFFSKLPASLLIQRASLCLQGGYWHSSVEETAHLFISLKLLYECHSWTETTPLGEFTVCHKIHVLNYTHTHTHIRTLTGTHSRHWGGSHLSMYTSPVSSVLQPLMGCRVLTVVTGIWILTHGLHISQPHSQRCLESLCVSLPLSLFNCVLVPA